MSKRAGDETEPAVSRMKIRIRLLEDQLAEAKRALSDEQNRVAAVLEGQEMLKQQTIRIRAAAGGGEGDTEEIVRRLRGYAVRATELLREALAVENLIGGVEEVKRILKWREDVRAALSAAIPAGTNRVIGVDLASGDDKTAVVTGTIQPDGRLRLDTGAASRACMAAVKKEMAEAKAAMGEPHVARRILGASVPEIGSQSNGPYEPQYLLHILRNPWGWSDEAVREARLAAANIVERSQLFTAPGRRTEYEYAEMGRPQGWHFLPDIRMWERDGDEAHSECNPNEALNMGDGSYRP